MVMSNLITNWKLETFYLSIVYDMSFGNHGLKENTTITLCLHTGAG